MNNNKLIGGIFFIVLGILFLLLNLGYISFEVLFSIFDLWPLILIVVGINIVFKKKPIIYFLTWTLFFITLIVYGALYQGRNNIGVGKEYNASFAKPMETSFGQLNLNTGAAKISMGSEENNLLSTNLQGAELDYKEKYKNNKETAVFSFSNKNVFRMRLNNKGSNYSFDLNNNVIWDLDLDLGAVSGTLDLEDIPVKSIDLDLGAGNLNIILGNKYGKSNIKIDSGASNLAIVIPKDVGIKLKIDSALSKINIGDLNLIKLEDYYISHNYEEMDTKLEFDIDIGVGKIDFKIR